MKATVDVMFSEIAGKKIGAAKIYLSIQEIALQDLSSSINTVSTETYLVSSSLAFLFHALCPHSTHIYLSKSEQLCCSVDQKYIKKSQRIF